MPAAAAAKVEVKAGAKVEVKANAAAPAAANAVVVKKVSITEFSKSIEIPKDMPELVKFNLAVSKISTTETTQKTELAQLEKDCITALKKVQDAKLARNKKLLEDAEAKVTAAKLALDTHNTTVKTTIASKRKVIEETEATSKKALHGIHDQKLKAFSEMQLTSEKELKVLEDKRPALITAAEIAIAGIDEEVAIYVKNQKSSNDTDSEKKEQAINDKISAWKLLEKQLTTDISSYNQTRGAEYKKIDEELAEARKKLTVAIAHQVHMSGSVDIVNLNNAAAAVPAPVAAANKS